MYGATPSGSFKGHVITLHVAMDCFPLTYQLASSFASIMGWMLCPRMSHAPDTSSSSPSLPVICMHLTARGFAEKGTVGSQQRRATVRHTYETSRSAGGLNSACFADLLPSAVLEIHAYVHGMSTLISDPPFESNHFSHPKAHFLISPERWMNPPTRLDVMNKRVFSALYLYRQIHRDHPSGSKMSQNCFMLSSYELLE